MTLCAGVKAVRAEYTVGSVPVGSELVIVRPGVFAVRAV